ncbi:unnamed protein product [Symbiodinium sp. CCMP2592]|nr:unnamed protein product [Symbiodinium sp. CCMP2592]
MKFASPVAACLLARLVAQSSPLPDCNGGACAANSASLLQRRACGQQSTRRTHSEDATLDSTLQKKARYVDDGESLRAFGYRPKLLRLIFDMNYNFQEGYEQATVQEAIPSMVSPAVTLAVVALVETYLGVSVDSDGVSVSFESDASHHATVQCDLLCPKKAKCSKEALAEISKDVLDEEIKMRMAEYELPDGLSAFAVATDGTVDYMDLFPSTTTTTNVGLVFGSFSVFYATASLPANWEEICGLAVRQAVASMMGHGLKDSDITLALGKSQVSYSFLSPPHVSAEHMKQRATRISDDTLQSEILAALKRLGIDTGRLDFKASFIEERSGEILKPAKLSLDEMEAMHPCSSFSDFLPDAPMSDSAGWCDMSKSNISQCDCVAADCTAYGFPDDFYCHCDTRERCLAAGLEFKVHTCAEEMSQYIKDAEYPPLILTAREEGCDGVVTSWHTSLAMVFESMSTKCCASWPVRLCDPQAELVTPCQEPSDFKPKALLSTGHSCLDEIKNSTEEYKLLELAASEGCKESGLSSGVKLEEWVRSIAAICCKSFPANICKPVA